MSHVTHHTSHVTRRTSQVRVGDSEMTIFEGTKNYRSGSILLRGANSYM